MRRAELDRAPIDVAISPLPTMLTLARDALQHGRLGTPARWRNAVVSRLRARDGDRDVTPSTAWDPVRREPERWLRAYVDAMRRTWDALAPLWRRSIGLVDREVETLKAAVDRGVPNAQIANEIIPRATLADDALLLVPTDHARRLSIDRHGVIATPIIAAPGAATLCSPGDFLVRFAYPLREVWRAFDGEPPPPASLEALIGAPRARLLQALDGSRRAGALAEILDLTPGAVTYHLRALESAGLIVRQRRGRHVIVHCTSRGTALKCFVLAPRCVASA